MTRGERIRACLLEGPSRSREIADTTGIPVNNVSARLKFMQAEGQVEVIGRIRCKNGWVNIYAFTSTYLRRLIARRRNIEPIPAGAD